jgi:hypothetical protein
VVGLCGLRSRHPRGSGDLAGLPLIGRESARASTGQQGMWGVGGQGDGKVPGTASSGGSLWGPAVGREGRSGWREGWGSGADQHGTSTITCLLDRRTSGKTDTWTSRLQEKGAGRRGPSFTSQQEMSQTPSKWEGGREGSPVG